MLAVSDSLLNTQHTPHREHHMRSITVQKLGNGTYRIQLTNTTETHTTTTQANAAKAACAIAYRETAGKVVWCQSVTLSQIRLDARSHALTVLRF